MKIAAIQAPLGHGPIDLAKLAKACQLLRWGTL